MECPQFRSRTRRRRTRITSPLGPSVSVSVIYTQRAFLQHATQRPGAQLVTLGHEGLTTSMTFLRLVRSSCARSATTRLLQRKRWVTNTRSRSPSRGRARAPRPKTPALLRDPKIVSSLRENSITDRTPDRDPDDHTHAGRCYGVDRGAMTLGSARVAWIPRPGPLPHRSLLTIAGHAVSPPRPLPPRRASRRAQPRAQSVQHEHPRAAVTRADERRLPITPAPYTTTLSSPVTLATRDDCIQWRPARQARSARRRAHPRGRARASSPRLRSPKAPSTCTPSTFKRTQQLGRPLRQR